MEYVTLDFLPRKRRMVCQNSLFGEKYLGSNRWLSSLDFFLFSLSFFTAKVATFCYSVYRDYKSDDNLSWSQVLSATFFARIASLTSWFHQDVLFSLSPTNECRFCQQLSADDEMIVDLSSSQSFSMSSDETGSCLNLDDILDENSFLISLSSKASHLIR